MPTTKNIAESKFRRLVRWFNEPASEGADKASRILHRMAPLLAAVVPVTIAVLRHR